MLFRSPSGKQVMSEIAWSPYACTIAISPNPFEVTAGRQMVFDARADFPPKGARYRWSSTGRVTKDGLESAPVQFDTEGPASVTVTLCDAAGKTLCVATAVGRVKKKEAPPEQPDVDKPADDNAPAHGVWRLAERQVNAPTDEIHKYDVAENMVNCRNIHLEDNRVLYHTRHSWTALPRTLVPGQEYTVRLTAQYLTYPADEPGSRTGITLATSNMAETEVATAAGSKDPVSQQFTIKVGRGRPGATWGLWLSGAGGWMHWRIAYTYEWAP